MNIIQCPIEFRKIIVPECYETKKNKKITVPGILWGERQLIDARINSILIGNIEILQDFILNGNNVVTIKKSYVSLYDYTSDYRRTYNNYIDYYIDKFNEKQDTLFLIEFEDINSKIYDWAFLSSFQRDEIFDNTFSK